VPRGARGPDLGVLGSPGVDLLTGSRFLEFPIQIRVAEIAQVRGNRQAHAPTRNNVGGYMKGESERTEKPKTQKQMVISASVHSVAAASVMLPVRLPEGPYRRSL
jgi:hypothetical protein